MYELFNTKPNILNIEFDFMNRLKIIKTCKKLFETTIKHDVKNSFKVHIWIGVLFVQTFI
jgi:hypothetical protein